MAKTSVSIPMFSGELSFMGCPRIEPGGDISYDSLIVLGVPFDASTSNRPGCRFGPRAIRIASKMISWQKLYPWTTDIYGTGGGKESGVFDGGDIDFDFGRVESVKDAVENTVSHIYRSGGRVLVLGGDHFISYPILRSLSKEIKQPVALIHFDAHYDMWKDEGGVKKRIDHGTGFYHALQEGILDAPHSLQIGLRTHRDEDEGDKRDNNKINFLDAFESDRITAEEIAMKIQKQVGDTPAYLTFDIDSLDPAFAPGTGTPVCGGFSTIKILDILRRLGELNWCGGDVVEVSPPYDHGEITSLAGATIAAYLGYLIKESNFKFRDLK